MLFVTHLGWASGHLFSTGACALFADGIGIWLGSPTPFMHQELDLVQYLQIYSLLKIQS